MSLFDLDSFRRYNHIYHDQQCKQMLQIRRADSRRMVYLAATSSVNSHSSHQMTVRRPSKTSVAAKIQLASSIVCHGLSPCCSFMNRSCDAPTFINVLCCQKAQGIMPTNDTNFQVFWFSDFTRINVGLHQHTAQVL